MYKNIENQIKKLGNNSRLSFPKEYLIKKLTRLKRAKIQYLPKPKDYQATTSGLNDLALIESFESQKEIDITTINNIISFLEEEDTSTVSTQSSLMKFCEILSDKCKSIQKVSEENRQSLHKFIKDITHRLEIISAQIDWKDPQDDASSRRYLKNLKDFVRRTRSSKKQFSKNERKREKRAYSIESMERIIQVHEHIIGRANEILKRNGISEIDADSLTALKKYRKMVDSKDPKLLEKSYFDSAVKEIQSTV